MALIVEFDGITNLDICPDKVLEAAVGQLETAVVLGWDTEGEVYIASSTGDLKEVLWLIEIAKQKILEGV